jgi:hypothetical protein
MPAPRRPRQASEERQNLACRQAEMLVDLLRQNTQLTETVRELTRRIERLTAEVHARVTQAQ